MGITDGNIGSTDYDDYFALVLTEIDKRMHHLEQKVAALEIKEAAKRSHNKRVATQKPRPKSPKATS